MRRLVESSATVSPRRMRFLAVGTAAVASTTAALPSSTNNNDDEESTDYVWSAGNARIIELSVGNSIAVVMCHSDASQCEICRRNAVRDVVEHDRALSRLDALHTRLWFDEHHSRRQGCSWCYIALCCPRAADRVEYL